MSALNCSFCSTSRDAVASNADQSAIICAKCASQANTKLNAPNPASLSDGTHADSNDTITPQKVKEKLDRYVIGHESAKRILSVGICNHVTRTRLALSKSNILLIGETGTGKTLLLKTLAAETKSPFIIADATTLTETGYMGNDVDYIIERLYSESNKSKSATEKGIICIDESDKLAIRAATTAQPKDVGGEGVQQALLKLMEGSVVTLQDGTDIDTKNILFIVSGAFVGLSINNNRKVSHQNVIEYGLIPELMGRLPIIGVLDQLTVRDLRRMLTEPKGSIVEEFTSIFKHQSIDLTFTDETLNDIAEQALAMNIGARGLRTVMETKLLDVMYDLSETPNSRYAC